jgi:hypothetical protein
MYWLDAVGEVTGVTLGLVSLFEETPSPTPPPGEVVKGNFQEVCNCAFSG